MKKLIVLAVILRLFVSAFLFHPDIKTFNYQASFLRAGVVNIYTYLTDHKSDLPLKEEFVYFPLTYFTLGVYQAIVSPLLGPEFNSWLADAGANSMVHDPYIFKYLIVLKLPYLALDLIIAYLLYRYFDDKKLGKRAVIVWLFNPFSIVIFYIFGNVDIFPVALTVAALLAAKEKRLTAASIILGLAAGFKLYPLLFVPFLALSGRDTVQKIKLLAAPFLVLAAIVLPFMSSAFVSSALVSGLSTRIFSPGVTIGFNETIITGMFAYTILLFVAITGGGKISLTKYFLATLLVIFSFTHFHIQWLSWVIPFAVILTVQKPKLGWMVLFIGILAFLIPPLYEDRSMTISLFRVYSTLYDILPTPFSILQNFYDPYSLQSIIHTVFAGVNLVLIYNMIFKKEGV